MEARHSAAHLRQPDRPAQKVQPAALCCSAGSRSTDSCALDDDRAQPAVDGSHTEACTCPGEEDNCRVNIAFFGTDACPVASSDAVLPNIFTHVPAHFDAIAWANTQANNDCSVPAAHTQANNVPNARPFHVRSRCVRDVQVYSPSRLLRR